MKIYKYYNWKIPKCVNLWRGYYRDPEYPEEIGFGDDTTISDNNAIELTLIEYLDYVEKIGKNRDEALDIFNKLSSLFQTTFQGKSVQNKDEVLEILQERITSIFSDPESKVSSTEYKERLMAQMICILLADSGRIGYDQTGIKGVIDKQSADAYILTLLPLWLQTIQVQAEADQFIQDNNL